MSSVLNGVVHGKIIELEKDAGLPDGQHVTVRFEAVEEVPPWLRRFDVNPSVAPGKLVIKGTCHIVEELAALLDNGVTDAQLQQRHPELTVDDLAALRQYARLPLELRRSFGAWANDSEQLDEFLADVRRMRRTTR